MQIRILSFPRLHPRPRASIVLRARTNPYEAGGGELELVLHMYERPLQVKYINNNIRGGSGIRYNYTSVRFATKIASTKITLATRQEGQNRSGPALYLASREH